ncbi:MULTISPECIES: hypothetical protein [unclassified Pseudomonas]|uniref:hypothetical protein n=1 Tax=unclassified Pseudomonas TaxID=196821 RepID=UPI001CBD4B0E|nr:MULTISPECIES: hypothetical protein [unclassified Pseudomonas]
MTTHSEAHFARRLLATLQNHHPSLVVETVKGRRVGAGSMRVIHITHSSGKFAQFPFPKKGLHAGAVSDELYLSACSMLMLTPVPEAM